MSIIRAPRPSASFTVLRNDVLHDDRLSYRARGLLVAILSRPDHWRTDAVTLQRGGTEGREAIRAALTELELAGYLQRRRSQDAQGRWRTAAFVFDSPQEDGNPSQLTLNTDGEPTPGNPPPVHNHDGSPTVGSPAVGGLGAVVKTGSKNSNLSVPTERATAAEDVIAKAVYDHCAGMVKYLGIRQIASRALKTGTAPEVIQAAMTALYDEGRPITLQTVGQRVAGTRTAGVIPPQDEHFKSGGRF